MRARIAFHCTSIYWNLVFINKFQVGENTNCVVGCCSVWGLFNVL